MQAARVAPAAAVVRVKKASSAASNDSGASSQEAPLAHQFHARSLPPTAAQRGDTKSSDTRAMPIVVGEVQEREGGHGEPPPTAPCAPHQGRAFPKAAHRKESKFALARRSNPSSSAPISTGVESTPASSSHESVRHTPSSPAATPHGGVVRSTLKQPNDDDMTEEAQIAASNARLVAAMSERQIKEAREEVASRLSPAMVEFLRNRGAQRSTTFLTSTSRLPTPTTTNALETSTTALKATGDVPKKQGDDNPSNESSVGARQDSTALSACSIEPPSRHNLHPSTQQEKFPPKQPSPAEKTINQSKAVAARLRFDVSGAVVGFVDRSSTAASTCGTESVAPSSSSVLQNVVSRDPLRQAEAVAAVEDGYTIVEACLLARSAVPQQRIFAFRLLASVLSHCRPGISHALSMPVPMPAEIFKALGLVCVKVEHAEHKPRCGKQHAKQHHPATPTWLDVWHHACHDADVAIVLRYALDDSHPHVIAAAAEALAALLGANSLDTALMTEAMDAAGGLAWPAVPLRHTQRASDDGFWVPSPIDLASKRRQKSLPRAADDDDDDIDDVDEQQLAKVDPVGGLVNMQVVERIAHIIATLQAPPAISPLLACLTVIALGGRDVASQAAATPGLLHALKRVLNSPLEDPKQLVVSLDAQHRALRTLRALCQSSASAMRAASDAGILRFAWTPLLRKVHETQQDDGTTNSALGQLVESLRLWRVAAVHDVYLLHMDDAFGALCTYLQPVYEPSEVGSTWPRERCKRWIAARECYLLLAQLRRHAAAGSHAPMISQHCLEAVAAQCIAWLAELPLIEVMHQAQQRRNDAGAHADDLLQPLEVGKGDSDAPLLRRQASAFPVIDVLETLYAENPAMLAVGAVAAALEFLATCYYGAIAAPSEPPARHQEDRKHVYAAVHRMGLFNPSEDQAAAALMQYVEKAIDGGGVSGVGMDDALLLASQALHLGTGISAAVSLAHLETCLLSADTVDASGVSDLAIAPLVLSPLRCRAPSLQRALATLGHSCDSSLLQPWDALRLQTTLVLARGVALALESQAHNEEHVPFESVQTVVSTALQVLPPGADDTALRLLALLFRPQHVEYTFQRAYEYLTRHRMELNMLVQGTDDDEVNVPPMPATAVAGRVLLAGYAATWLGYAQENQQSPQQMTGVSQSHVAMPGAAVLIPDGSCLPLTSTWPYQRILLPPPGSSATACSPSTANGFALLWALGLELLCHRADEALLPLQSLTVSNREKNIKAAMQLVFSEQHLAHIDIAATPEEHLWQDPLVRWSFAALIRIWSETAAMKTFERERSSKPTSCVTWNAMEARKLTEHFAAVSFGDRLFGVVMALFFRRSVPLAVQLEVLEVLNDNQALHLLPPVAAGCLGSAHTRSNGSLHAPPPTSPNEAQTARELYLRVLAGDNLAACVETKSMVLDVVVHRVAGLVFGDERQGALEASQRAYLVAVMRRLVGKNAGVGVAAERRRKVAGMLLRWDVVKGRVEHDDTAGGEGNKFAVPLLARRLELLETALCAFKETELLEAAKQACALVL